MRKWIKFLPLLLVGLTLFAHLSLAWISAAYFYGRNIGVRDTAGHQFGFGEPIRLSLLEAARPHIGLREIIAHANVVDYLFLLALVVAIAFCVPSPRNRLYRWHRNYLLAQLIFFPTGWLGVLVLLTIAFRLSSQTDFMDGEFIDEGMGMLSVHGLWVAGCLWCAVFSYLVEKTNPDLAEARA